MAESTPEGATAMAARICLFLLLISMHCLTHAQGVLEPPAPPGPTMKTLDQVEPRRPLSEPGSITEAGGYYLTEDIVGTINVNADNVSLDLNGFTITPVTGGAIRVSNRDRVRIFNGTIAGGTGAGIAGSPVGSITVSDLRLFDITGDCIDLNDPSGILTVERVHCHNATRSGIFMRQFQDQSLYAVIRDNVISNVNTSTNLSTYGIAISHNATGPLQVVVTGNRLLNNRVLGLLVQGNNATANGQVTDNLATGHGATGIIVSSDVVVARNISSGNGTNYSLTGQQAAPISALDQNPGPWDNISED